MRVFLTGATGFIGTAVAQELIGAGHSVLGVARTEEGAATLASRGVDPHRGDLTDPDSFISGARACDAVIQCAFIHDFSRFAENIEIEKKTVAAMLDALAGSGKPFVITSGVAMLAPGRMATEEDRPARQGRGETEALVREAADRGLRTSVIRLPPITHDSGGGGFVSPLVAVAQEKRVAAYVGDGANRWPAGHRLDAARLYRLALEKGEPGAAYHAVGDEGVPAREIAGAIGGRLGLKTASVSAEDAVNHFGWLGMFAGVDMPASSQITQERLGWRPTHARLIEDIDTAASLAATALTGGS
jgi:nucleoside-diphosphate-sugar epimerase